MTCQALVVIDIQNDYFAEGAFPLWNAEPTLAGALAAIRQARAQEMPVIFVQHLARAAAPFFNPGTWGAQLHEAVQREVGDSPVITKHHADAFHETALHETMQQLGVSELLLCGMMTQNCVTHTALSRSADLYAKVTVLTDACTTVTEMLHRIALSALSTRVGLATVAARFE